MFETAIKSLEMGYRKMNEYHQRLADYLLEKIVSFHTIKQ